MRFLPLKRQKNTSATGVAGIVHAMTNKPSFSAPLVSLVGELRRVFVPHLLCGMGIFLLAAYTNYIVLLKPISLPGWLHTWIAWLFFALYGGVALGYALFAACVYALYQASRAWEAFLDSLVERVKMHLTAKLDNWQDGIAKDQAKVLVRGSVREVVSGDGWKELAGFPRWLTRVFLGALTLAVRSVLVARVVKMSGQTVKLSKVFAGQASLTGAVFLNLRLFTGLLVVFVYAVGAFVLACNLLFVFWW